MSDNRLVRIKFGAGQEKVKAIVNQDLISTTANIVGTSYKGPAFVPQKIYFNNNVVQGGETVEVYNTAQNILGTDRQNRFEHLYDEYTHYISSDAYEALGAWLLNGKEQASFTRVLGVGENVRSTSTGKMIGAGFNAANNISSGTLDHTRSRYLSALPNGDSGSVCFMFKKFTEKSQRIPTARNIQVIRTNKIDYLSELGISDDANILTNVILFASGVMPELSNIASFNSSYNNTNSGSFSNTTTHKLLSNLTNDELGIFVNLVGYEPMYIQKKVNNVTTRKSNNYKPQPVVDQPQLLKTYNNQFHANQKETQLKKILDYNSKYKNDFSSRFLEKGYLNYTTFPLNGIENSAGLTNTLLVTKPYSTFTEEQAAISPDYNSWESEFSRAKTPWVTSQPINRSNFGNAGVYNVYSEENQSDNRIDIHTKVVNLFRFWSLDDGDVGNRFRIKINITQRGDKSNDSNEENLNYAKFDIYIFEYDPRDNAFINLANNSLGPVETFKDLDLNPNSSRYIGRVIGTKNTYCDLDSNKVIERGLYENKSQYLRVEIDEKIENVTYRRQYSMLPSGFRSYPHINFIKEAFLHYSDPNDDTIPIKGVNLKNMFNQGVYQLPPMYSLNYIEENPFLSESFAIKNNWGVSFENLFQDAVTPGLLEPKEKDVDAIIRVVNGENINSTNATCTQYISPHYYYSKYFLKGIDNESYSHRNVWVEEDNYLNSFFHLEKIYVTTETSGSDIIIKDIKDSVSSNISDLEVRYKHSGRPFTNRSVADKRYLNLDDDICWNDDNTLVRSLDNKLSFDFFTYGGFDGVDIRDFDKKRLSNDAIIRESNDPLESKSTLNSYKLGIDVATDYSNCGGDILIVPGIKEKEIIDKCIDICENDKRHFFITDISGSVSNVLTQFDDLRQELEQDETIANYTLKTSLGIMGSYYTVDDDVANYRINDSNIIEDTRFRLTEPNNPEAGDELTFYSYDKILNQQYFNIVSFWNSFNITSRYVFPVLGETISETGTILKQIKPEIFTLGLMAAINNPRVNLTELDFLPRLYSSLAPSYKLIDDLHHSDSNVINFDQNIKDLKSSGVNILYRPVSTGPIKLLSQSTPYENRLSVFRDQGIVRTLQEIKKRVKFDLFINQRFIAGGLFFTQNSNFSNIYQKLEIQLNSLMSQFVQEGLISNYKVRIPKSTEDETILDMQNYIIRGTIVLQMMSSDIIKLELDDILSDLSFLANASSDAVLLPVI